MDTVLDSSTIVLNDPTLRSLGSVIKFYNTSASSISSVYNSIPGSGIAWRYIVASHQNDPFRTLLEILLVFFIIRTYTQRRTRSDSRKRAFPKMTEEEVDDLIAEWTPQPLLPPPPAINPPPILLSSLSSHATIISPPNSEPITSVAKLISSAPIQKVLDLSSSNFSGFSDNSKIREKAVDCLKNYGVGSCGPPGFYGTFDVHMELESAISTFLSMPATCIYAQDTGAITSVIPSFAKRGDLIIADRGVNFAIQKGMEISRSHIKWFDHCDMKSLEEVLDREEKREKVELRRNGGKLRRKFIVTEGLFEHDGRLTDLTKIVELKRKYKYRLILDETWSFGILGKTGRGVTEVFSVPTSEIDILVGSLTHSLCSSGGFCAGSLDAIWQQRSNSLAFVYSAALPPLLAVAASEALSMLGKNPYEPGHPLEGLGAKVTEFRKILEPLEKSMVIRIPSSKVSPMIHVLPMFSAELREDREAQVKALDEVEMICRDRGVLVSRKRRLVGMEVVDWEEGLRICLSNGLSMEEIKMAAVVIGEAVQKVMSSNA